MVSMRKLKLAIIGCGAVVQKRYLPASMLKLKRVLGWKQRITFKEAMQSIKEWQEYQ